MQNVSRDIDLLRQVARSECSLNWYAIADSAQHSGLPKVITSDLSIARCLLGAPEGSPLAQKSPHLVELCSPTVVSNAWSWISLNAASKPCISIIATEKSFDDLFDHLSGCTEVVLPDGDAMYLAFWDPAILGTIMGQCGDQTLHVKGPVLDREQRAGMMSETMNWWYWDRLGKMHSIVHVGSVREAHGGPITLTQMQVDDLVEASVPDHLMYHIKLNQPYIFANVVPENRYLFVSHALVRARAIGLTGMRDLVNYICMELIYKERMHEDAIKRVLDDVRTGRVQFDTALDQLP